MDVTCRSCLGVFEKSEEKCPFCGTFYYEGAEQQYLENLDDIAEDLDKLREHTREEVTEDRRTIGENILKILFKTAFLVCFLLMIGYFFVNHSQKSPVTVEQQKSQLLWEKETYPLLDEWYALGEYDKIMTFYDDLTADENNVYTLAQWEPFIFLLKYRENLMFHDIQNNYFNTGELEPVNLGKILISTLDDTIYYLYSEEEKLKVDAYVREQKLFLQEELYYTDTELEKIKEKAFEQGRFDRDICYEEAEERCDKIR